MSFYRYLYRIKKSFICILSFKGFEALLSSFGVLWLLIEVIKFFSKDASLKNYLQHLWWLFLLAGLAYAIYQCWPVTTVIAQLKDRDIHIEIAIGDLFKFDGALVIGSNTSFVTDISHSLISESSIQGQFTRRYYRAEDQLASDISRGLVGVTVENSGNQQNGENDRYPIGTVVRVDPKERIAYLVAIAHMNAHGVAHGTYDDLKQSLARLWVFVGERGSKEPIVMPVLGTGWARIKPQRREVIEEMVKSFVAACSEKTFCEKLTIVISENDALKYKIDLVELGQHLSFMCKSNEMISGTDRSVGTSIE